MDSWRSLDLSDCLVTTHQAIGNRLKPQRDRCSRGRDVAGTLLTMVSFYCADEGNGDSGRLGRLKVCGLREKLMLATGTSLIMPLRWVLFYSRSSCSRAYSAETTHR